MYIAKPLFLPCCPLQELVSKVVDKALPRPVFIAADLSVMSLKQALNGSGFDATKKTLFTVEGATYCTDHDSIRATCCNPFHS